MVEPDYKKLHPREYDLGFNSGIKSYENCERKKGRGYKDPEKRTAFKYGTIAGYEEAERNDFTTKTDG